MRMSAIKHSIEWSCVSSIESISANGVVAMTDIVTTPLLLAAVPIIGAMLGLVVWSQPEKLRIWSIVVTVLSLLAVIGTSGRLTGTTEGLLFLYLLPLAACVSLLGGPVHGNIGSPGS